MNECDISFVVPVYNASLHLEEWKKSLLKVIIRAGFWRLAIALAIVKVL